MAAKRMTPHIAFPSAMVRRVTLASLLVGVASCVPATSAYRNVPGLRGPEVTVAVDPLPVGAVAPRLMTTPLEQGPPAEFDVASLPALDAVTNPAILQPVGMQPPFIPGDPANIPPGAPSPFPPVKAQPLPNYASLPFNAGPSVAAYAFRGSSAMDSIRAQQCLTAAIYYEAASESEDGQRAVAQVVLNRVRHPAYPNTVCDVVYQGTERGDKLCQFSFACDGSMARIPGRDAWARASRIARAALAGYVFGPVGAATHYHTLAVNPAWNKSLVPTIIIGAHIFFRWGGAAGQPRAFYASYRGSEPFPGPRISVRRPAVPVLGPGLNMGPGGVIATGPVPVPAPSASDNSLAAIQARAEQSMLAQQAAQARADQRYAAPVARPVAQDNRYVSGALPESDIRPEFRSSGQWIGRPN